MKVFPKSAYGNVAAAFAAALFALFLDVNDAPRAGSLFWLYALANVVMCIVRFFRWLNKPIPPPTIRIEVEIVDSRDK